LKSPGALAATAKVDPGPISKQVAIQRKQTAQAGRPLAMSAKMMKAGYAGLPRT